VELKPGLCHQLGLVARPEMEDTGLVVTIGAVLGVAAVALGMVITPGPNMMYLVSRSIAQGRIAGLVSLTGVVCGFMVYVVATSVGLSALFAAVPALFHAIKLAGAAYLLWLAWGFLWGGRSAFAARELEPHRNRSLFATGLTTCLLNPKIALMYGALLPPIRRPVTGQRPRATDHPGRRPDRCRRGGEWLLGVRCGRRRRLLRGPATRRAHPTLDRRISSRSVRGTSGHEQCFLGPANLLFSIYRAAKLPVSPAAVTVTRYLYWGNKIPNPYLRTNHT
jgi:threonine/homoserine/homoserine lactone efflux protein